MDREEPHSDEAEGAFLGSLLMDRDAIASIADWVPPDAFYHQHNKIIYQAMLGLWRATPRRPCDIVTLTDLLRSRNRLEEARGISYITSLLSEVPTAVHVEYYGEILMAHAKRRAIITSALSVINDAYKEDVNEDDAAGLIRRSAQGFSLVPPEPTSQEAVEQLRETTLARWAGELVDDIMPTGMADMDKKMLGGMRGGDLIYVGGRPGSGKTSMALQMSKAVMQRGKVPLFVELEMTRDALLNRIIAGEANVPYATAFNVVGDQAKREAWLDASARVEEWPLEIHADLRSTDRINAWCLKNQDKDIGAIFVDHMDYLSDPDLRGASVEQRTAETSKRLKAMAMTLNVPVVVLSQLNRSVEAVDPFKPDLLHFRYSGAVEQDAEYGILLYRRKYYVDRGRLDPKDAEDYLPHSNRHRAEANFAKNRNGEVGIVEMGWIPDQMRFVERYAA